MERRLTEKKYWSLGRIVTVVGSSLAVSGLTLWWKCMQGAKKPALATPAEPTPEPTLEELFPLDINLASLDELMMVPGLGPSTAESLIQQRPFNSLEDLTRVGGIGPKKLEQLAPFLALKS
ncbi:MAG: ComEA family DNA-binding protein [Verrucomicrobiales bacterium]